MEFKIIERISKMFKLDGKIIKISHQTNGLINKTYLVDTTKYSYIIQRINKYVFKEPQKLMDNIEQITKYIVKKTNNKNSTLEVIKTIDEQNIYYDKNTDEYFRAYLYLNNSITYYTNPSLKQLFEAGCCIGDFQNYLCDFNSSILYETIKDFHNTPNRLLNLLKAYKNTTRNNKQKIVKEINYILLNRNNITKINYLIKKRILPLRVTHNDTKLNNIIFNQKTKKAICMIDLDTVMEGTILNDYGDAIRIIASSVEEDEDNYHKMFFNEKAFIYFTIGYLFKTFSFLTAIEKKLLIESIYTISMECAIRFLTDYLEGNKYFLIKHSEHNLIRAKNQLYFSKLVKGKEIQLKIIINKIIEHITCEK